MHNWGNALAGLAELVAEEDAEAARQYYEQAGEKYQQAVGIKPDNHEALNTWASALVHSAHLETGDEREALLQRAEELAEKAEEIERDSGLYNLACVYALQGREEAAFPKLRETLEQGKIQWSHVAEDRDWDELRNHEEYNRLEAEFGEL